MLHDIAILFSNVFAQAISQLHMWPIGTTLVTVLVTLSPVKVPAFMGSHYFLLFWEQYSYHPWTQVVNANSKNEPGM